METIQQVSAACVPVSYTHLARREMLRLLRLNIRVNGEFLIQYHADGVIVGTPTGSTGYNLSAGGPIVEPTARMTILTPISAHSLNGRSVVLSSEDQIEIEVMGHVQDGDVYKRQVWMKRKVDLQNVNMKKLFRRNQIIVTTLAVMIAVAGYLNYMGSQSDGDQGAYTAGNTSYEAGALEISDEDILKENQTVLNGAEDYQEKMCIRDSIGRFCLKVLSLS